MFVLRWTQEAAAKYEELRRAAEKSLQTRKKTGKSKSSPAEGLFKQIQKTLALLQSNPRHPGLNTHAYDSLEHPFEVGEKVWEAYAQNNTPGAYRVFWCYGPGTKELTVIAITPHP